MLGADQRLSFHFSNIKERREHSFPFSLLLPLLGNKINGFVVLFFLKQTTSLYDVKAVLQAGPSQKTKRGLEAAKNKSGA